ncbi:MAG: isoprenylcysteine carboxylmethyltransferase family protein [Xanthobacteraceae bacterium]
MFIRPRVVFAVIWIGWIVSWMAAAFWSNRTEKLAVTWDTLLYRVSIVAGFVLMTPWASRWLLAAPLWHVGYAGAYVLAALTLAGILFAWWARIHIGRLWSGSITRKQDHHVVDTGPYALVRHPIYMGLILALLATAVAQATANALAGAALLSVGFWLKARAEERFLTTELGADAYGAYRRRVPMLVPSLRQRPGDD